jgi:hypothetical protein
MSERVWLYDTSACVDCYMAAAGAPVDTADTPDCEPLTGVGAGECAETGWRFPSAGMADNPDPDSLGFSWSPCECCDSRLGGDRFAVSVWAVSA